MSRNHASLSMALAVAMGLGLPGVPAWAAAAGPAPARIVPPAASGGVPSSPGAVGGPPGSPAGSRAGGSAGIVTNPTNGVPTQNAGPLTSGSQSGGAAVASPSAGATAAPGAGAVPGATVTPGASAATGAGNPGAAGGSGGTPGVGPVTGQPSQPGGAGPTTLGMDISRAGTSAATQLAFFNGLPESEQSNLRTRCVYVEATPASAVDPRQRSFCDTILANR